MHEIGQLLMKKLPEQFSFDSYGTAQAAVLFISISQKNECK